MHGQLAALADVTALLDQRRVAYWLFGGWGVDFYAGRVTRSHGDLDLAVFAKDGEVIHSALITSGWHHAPTPDEDGGTGYERSGVRLEITYLATGESGQVFVVLRDGPVLWSKHPLGNRLVELEGVRARLIPLELLRQGKARTRDDPDEAAIDRADFETLSRIGAETFGAQQGHEPDAGMPKTA
jgi:aminoglycoside-2''-adenylyltransferase